MPNSLAYKLNTQNFNRRVQHFIQTQKREADRIVFKVAADVLADIVIGWPVDSGVSRSAWKGPFQVRPLTYRISNPTVYAAIPEYGGYPGVGPKTEDLPPTIFPGGIKVDAGIFPSQRPHAPVRRSLSQHRDDIQDELRRALRSGWGR